MRMPGVGGSALMVNSLAAGPERALRKRQMKDDRQAQAIRLGLAGVNVLGDLGTQIYAIRSRNQNEAAEHALRRALQEKGQSFLREQAGYEHGLGAGDRAAQLKLKQDELRQQAELAREGMASEERQAVTRNRGDTIESKLAEIDAIEAYQKAKAMKPSFQRGVDQVAPLAQAADVQERLFGKEPRLQPDFYRGLEPGQGATRMRQGSPLRDELVETLATLKQAGLSPEELQAALAELRGAKLPFQQEGGGGLNRNFPFGGPHELMELFRGQAPGTDRLMEERLLEELLGGGGPAGPPAPADQAQMEAFARRRAYRRP